MLNAKTLTDTLSRMELPELYNYATLHKNDPYVVSMALSIANQKKQADIAKQGQAGMMPQPKVVDQALAQMMPQAQMAQQMPENIGIGQLPAPNMQRMAEGGIVAFEEGGDVPGYAGGGIPQVGQLSAQQLANLFATDPQLAEEAIRRAGPLGEKLRGAANAFLGKQFPHGPLPTMLAADLASTGYALADTANKNVAKMTPQQREALYSNPMLSTMSNDAGLAAAIQNAPGMAKPEMSYAEQMGNVLSFLPKTLISAPADKQSPKGYGLTRLFADSDTKPAATAPANKPVAPTTSAAYDSTTATRRSDFGTQKPPATGRVGAGQAGAPSSAGLAGAAPASATQASGISSLNTKPMSAAEAAEQAAALGDDKEVRKSLQDYVERQKQVGDAAMISFQQGIAGLPEAYKKYEARLQKEEAEAETDKDKAVGMSIFKAGLAMMAGTSQNPFENISKGALVGAEDYQAALKDFKKAQRERDKSFADIEQARLADQRGDLKTKLELENRAADRNANAEGKMVDGIAKLFDTNKTNARALFQTGFEQANQNQRTVYTSGVELQKQAMSDAAAMARTNAQVAGSLKAAQLNADTYKLPMLYKSVEDSVDKMLQNNTNYKLADEATKATMRETELRRRLLATPGLAQYAPAASGGGGGGLRYNPQTGKIE